MMRLTTYKIERIIIIVVSYNIRVVSISDIRDTRHYPPPV